MAQRKVITISGSDLEELKLSVEEVEGLWEVDISENNLEAVPSALQNCPTIRYLNCSFNKISITASKIEHEETDFFKPQIENKFELLHPEDSIYSDDDLKDSTSSAPMSPGVGILCPIDRTFDFSKLENLTVLNLSHNRIDCLPDSFFFLKNLESLNLSHNLITFLPHHFKSDENLRQLDLSWNLISEPPHWFQNLARCVRISLSGNPLSEVIFPQSFGNTCRRIRFLEIENTFIRNFPTALTSLLDLRHLKVSNKKITMEQVRFSNKEIYFDSEKKNNECSSKRNTLFSLPETFVNLIGLAKLEMIDVKLRDLPESFGQLKSLKILDVSRNHLYWIPRTFVSLSNLEFCNISKNEITILDLDFDKMKKLQHFIACFNKITEIPESLCKMKSLETLDLYSNKIMSVSPLIKSMNLKRLDIARNLVVEHSLEELGYLEQYQSLQSNIRSCNFEWDLLTTEKYNMDTSIFRERNELHTKVTEQFSYRNHKHRSIDFSFSSIESEEDDESEVLRAARTCPDNSHDTDVDHDWDVRLEDSLVLPPSRNKVYKGRSRGSVKESHQFDDAD